MSFIHFGCWNKGKCDLNENGINGMSSVMKTLIHTEVAPNFYIIAGDNYYPSKRKGAKGKYNILDKEKFKSGFDCAEKLTEKAPVYMLMGNHDLQYENALYDSQSNEKLDKCAVTTIQVQDKYKEVFNFNVFRKLLNDHTLILFINSMLYTTDRQVLFDCFKKFRYSDANRLENIDDIQHFEEKIIGILANYYSTEEDIKNIIIVGHEPILSRRNHKKSAKQKIPLIKSGIEFLNTIYSKFPEANKYYLCADVHQYQKGKVIIGDNIITQYVVGTGGTDCDLDCATPDAAMEDISVGHIDPITIRFQLEECQQNFGYLLCQCEEGDTLKFTYKSVAGCEVNTISGGRRRKKKTRKFKRKRRSRKIKRGKRTSRRK